MRACVHVPACVHVCVRAQMCATEIDVGARQSSCVTMTEREKAHRQTDKYTEEKGKERRGKRK